MSDYIISLEHLNREAELMCDKNTDLLINTENVVIFPYSRIFVDVERFNNESEEMNKVGMGVLYTHSHDLKPIRIIKDKKNIIKFYNEHHLKLNSLAKDILEEYNELLIIDLHSYSENPLEYQLHKDLERPDICIGIDDFHMDEKLKSKILFIVKESEFSFAINQPFIGSLVPSDYLNDSRVKSVMIDVNKRVMNSDFEKVKELVKCLTDIL